jgi:large subunit ribosomal protein L4
MTTLPVFDLAGNKVGDYEIDPASIAPKVSKQLLHDVVVMYLANKRQGSNKTKTRGEVSGSTKKLYKQKGTGNARAATRMAIASKISSGSVVVVDQLKMDAPKTKTLAAAFKALGLEGQTKTLAIGGVDRNVYLSGRNIQGCTVSTVSDLNALAVLRPRKLVVTREALDWIKSRVG